MPAPLRRLKLCADGTHTIEIASAGLTYHSRYGAIQESQHVFIESGLRIAIQAGTPLRILEIGFGTGLNAFLSAIETIEQGPKLHYHALEAFPLEPELYRALNYPDMLGHPELFQALHDAAWEQEVSLHEHFLLEKHQIDFLKFRPTKRYQLIFFDAFAPEIQPELWTQDFFETLGCLMMPGGILTTYCSKGCVRRAMQAAGWAVTKIPGPPGKREIVRATWCME
ncbi:MAG: tRNA (5-methylaminomethyl-2-thiouridine)(34)-methyltransferase MnmD [Bacteroidetes bacterium]|nr:tRNA (5-methylaminomethyl-2-thiouridine)(34)-methyltransferase MnmD [Bacteroidota bacterium]